MTEKRILIVEDERIVAEDLKRLLVKMGYGVTGIAASGEEAFQSVKNQKPDLVLMDIRIQGPQDGIEVAEYLYAEYDLPVSYLTAFADAPTLDRAKATMPYGYILKPFEPRSLQAVIELAIHRHMMESVVSEMDGWHARVLHSLPGALIAADRLGRIVFINKGVEKLTGWTPDFLFGKPLSEYLTEEKESLPVHGTACPGSIQTKSNGFVPITYTRTALPGEDGNTEGDLIVIKTDYPEKLS
jgi:CheY-like chemotaxis protein